MKTLIKFLLSILFLPIVLIVDNFKTSRSLGKKILLLFVILLIFGITWINGYRKLFQISEVVLFNLGIRDKIVNVDVRGQSMLPTINDGDVVTLHSPKKYTPEKGDIVSFSNIETSGQYYIKRIIAMEGETISLENGAVKVNGNYLIEDYVYKNSPTYGNTFLMDCREHKVPKGKVAVMGDNRIASTDSRVIGFVNLKDIEGVIKTGVKPTEVSTHVGEAVDQETINKSVFLGYLNERRSKKSLGGLREVDMLTDFATEKANFISENIDTWKSNSVDLSHAIEESGYDFLLVQEVVTMGKYDEEQLVNHLLGLVPYDQDFLSDKYIDIGIGISETNIGTCSTPIFVIILGWPTNPGYSKEQVSQWDYNIEKLSMLVSILRDLKQNPNIDFASTEELINLSTQALEKTLMIRNIILEGRWFSENEMGIIVEYENMLIGQREKISQYLLNYSAFIENTEYKEFLEDFKWSDPVYNAKIQEVRMFYAQGKYEDQLKSARELLSLSNDDQERAVSHYWQGLAYYNLRNTTAARTNLLESIKLDENFAGPYVTLSAISLTEGNFQQSLTYALKCAELDPEYGWCYNNIGLTFAYLGDKTNAISNLERAVELDPDSFLFADNLKRVRAGL